MALFTDGQINGTSDLQDYESSVLTMAGVEGVDITAKMALAQEEIGNQVLLFLLRAPLRDSRAAVRRTIGVCDVVITRPLKHWHTVKSLALAYRDAYNSQLNDRYLGKWNEYEQLAQDAAQEYLQIGVGLVADPIPKGSDPVLTTIGGSGTGATYYVAVSWLNASGQEGALSDIGSMMTANGTQLAVSTANAPGNAAGWNVYAGTAADSITLQNVMPIALSSNWIPPASGLISGRRPGDGQAPERFLFHDRLLQRG